MSSPIVLPPDLQSTANWYQGYKTRRAVRCRRDGSRRDGRRRNLPRRTFEIDQFGYLPQAKRSPCFASPFRGSMRPCRFRPVAYPGEAGQRSTGRFPPRPRYGTAAPPRAIGRSGLAKVDFSAFTVPGAIFSTIPRRVFRQSRLTSATTCTTSSFGRPCHVLLSTMRNSEGRPYVPAGWTDAVCHLGPQQDLDCRSVLNPVPSTSRDLSGGWHDAGDYNKNTSITPTPRLHSLLFAYQDVPWYWQDDYGIPESGNGIPDPLSTRSEWEVDWMLKMQNPDGSVLHKMAVTDFSAPAHPAWTADRRYALPPRRPRSPPAGPMAMRPWSLHHCRKLSPTRRPLQTAAVNAWNWLVANPGAIPSSYNNAGFVNAAAEESAYDQQTSRLCAAIYLFRLDRP
mgnify:CR=1 FL=1